MPSVSSIFNIFAKSPLEPMQNHIEICFDCAGDLTHFFDATQEADWAQAEIIYKTISQKEHAADEIKKQLRLSLPNSLFLPVDRNDLIQMILLQDKIANRSKDIAGLILGRQMAFPAEVHEHYLKLLAACLKTVARAKDAINELDELLETGFRGSEASLVEKMIIELDQCEGETDTIQVALRRHLYSVEKDISPIDALFLYRVIDWTGDLADYSQNLGGQLQLLLAR